MKSSLHLLILFLQLFSNCQLNSIPLLPSSNPGRLVSSFYAVTASLRTLLYNTLHGPRRKHSLSIDGKTHLTTPLHSNRSDSIVACVLFAAGMWLPNRCLAMNIYSDFIIPAFRRHVTLAFTFQNLLSFCLLYK
jgi:hypothetical protein